MRISILLAMLAALLGSACAPSPTPDRPSATSLAQSPVARARGALARADSGYVMVIAHRACWRGGAPENSLSAIAACLAMEVDMVELDVRRTSDGVLVLMHDDTVDRTTNGHGKVADLSFADIRRLRLRKGDGGAAAMLTDEQVPTFEEAMRAVRGRVLVNLDAKADVYDDAFAILEKTGTIDHILMKRSVAESDPPLVSTRPFDRVLAMPILTEGTGRAERLLQSQGGNAPVAYELIFDHLAYLKAAAPLIKAQSARVWVNTLAPHHAAGITDTTALSSPETTWGVLLGIGVNMIQTDEPEVLIEYLEVAGRRKIP